MKLYRRRARKYKEVGRQIVQGKEWTFSALTPTVYIVGREHLVPERLSYVG